MASLGKMKGYRKEPTIIGKRIMSMQTAQLSPKISLGRK